MKKFLIGVVIAVLVGFGIYKKVYIPKHTFKTISPQKTTMNIKVNGVGEVSSKELYKIGAVYGGKVLQLTVNEGEYIKKGSLIAKIDSIDLKDKIAELDATIRKLNSDIDSLKVDKKSAIATYNYQEEILKKNKKLFKKGAISELDFKKFQTNATVAKLKIESIKSKISSLHNQSLQLKASLSGLKEKLSRYTIIAPVSGYIVKKYISNYAIVNPNQTLVDIVDPKDVWVATYIDTRLSGDVKIGDIASIKLQSSSKIYKGKVVNIKPINNNITYEREIDVSFDNLPIPFYLQEQAVVDIKIKTIKNIIKIPLKVLSFYNKKDGVWVLENNRAKFIPITVLSYGKNSIGTKDISVDTKIIVPNPKKKTLSDGMIIYHD